MRLDDAIYRRVSVRYFKEVPVDRDKVMELIKAAIRAPTASDLENWLFVVFTDDAKRKRLHELIAEGMERYYTATGISEGKLEKLRRKMYVDGMYRAPVYIAVFIDRNVRFLRGPEYDELEHVWSVESAAMAIENLMLKAVDLGLGTVYVGVTNMNGIEEKVRRLAGLGDSYALIGVIPIGYPKRDVKPRRRRPVNDVTVFL